MKKKIIYGLLFAVTMVTASSSFVSCKDYEGDDYATLHEQLLQAQRNTETSIEEMIRLQEAQIKYQLDNLAEAIARLNQGKTEYDDALASYQKRLNDLMAQYKKATTVAEKMAILSQMNQLLLEIDGAEQSSGVPNATESIILMWGDSLRFAYQNSINAYNLAYTAYQDAAKAQAAADNAQAAANNAQTSADNAQTAANNAQSTADAAYGLAGTANAAAAAAQTAADNAQAAADNAQTTADQAVADAAAALAEAQRLYADAVRIADEALQAAVENLQGQIDDLDEKTTARADELEAAYKAADEKLQEQINALNGNLNELDNRVTAIEELLKNIFKTEITGIEIQAAVNPIYGSFSYPVGVQSNVLATYYGEFANASKFPVGDDVLDEAVWASGAPAVLTEELNAINAPIKEYVAGTIAMDTEEGNAGQLYLTVNPSNVDFSGATFTLRNSQNKVSKVTLSELKDASDTELKWGYFRAPGNGFYVANATIAPADAKNVDFNVDYKSIQSEFDNIMTDWTKTSAADVAKLALAVTNAVKVDVPRLGVQAQWQDPLNNEWKNYVSKYDLAAVSITPLSYDFLAEANYAAPIEKVRDQITGKLKALDKEITNQIAGLINVAIAYPSGTPGVDQVYTTTDGAGKKHVFMVVPAVPFTASTPTGQKVTITTGKIANANDLYDGSPAVPSSNVDLPVSITVNGNTTATVIEITNLFDSIKNGIENGLSGVNSISGTVDKYINRVINLETKVLNKLANVAKNPNRFIQPALIAQTADFGYFYPSRIYFAPTQVKKGTKISFYPTTLTGEVVAPAYKKYVAILNDKKFNPSDTPLNTVFAGNEYNLQKPFEYTVDAPAGTVLEFIYECLDYTGKVAGKKYYIEVYE